MQVKDVLPGGFAVLLNDAYTVSVGGCLNGWGNMFGDDVDAA